MLASATLKLPAIAMFLFLVMPAGSARATPVTWSFEGVLFVIEGHQPELDQLAALGVVDGAPFDGTLTFESTTTDSDPPNGLYDEAISEVNVRVGSWALSRDETRRTEIRVSPALFFPPIIDVGPRISFSASLNDDPDVSDAHYQFYIVFDIEATLGALPLDPAQLGAYSLASSVLRENHCFNPGFCPGTEFDFQVQTLALVAPEPGALPLVGAGALALGVARLLRRA